MAYGDVVEMAESNSLLRRIAAAAAAEGEPSALTWAMERSWKFASQPGWADAWKYAQDTATINQNPDTGVRNDVIDDQMILTAVQNVRAAEATA